MMVKSSMLLLPAHAQNVRQETAATAAEDTENAETDIKKHADKRKRV